MNESARLRHGQVVRGLNLWKIGCMTQCMIAAGTEDVRTTEVLENVLFVPVGV